VLFRSWVNDRRASGEALRALSASLVELHGQQDDGGLLNPRGHRIMLDTFAGVDKQAAQVRTTWKEMAAARKQLDALQAAVDAVRAEEEFLRHAVAELDDLNPQPGEDAELDTSRRAMQRAVRIRDDVARAHDMLGIGGAEGSMSDALRWLDGVTADADGMLEEPIAALGRALVDLGEAHDGVARALAALDVNPAELEATEERLFAIRALARKHEVAPDDLGDFAQTLRSRITALEAGESDLDTQRATLRAAEDAYDRAADHLSKARQSNAARLDKAVMAELAPLKMERAACPHFGVRAWGVHMNGYVRCDDALHMWVATRARDKPTYPGMLDNMVAGGQPHGIGLYDNMVKECAEEAGIPFGIAARLRSVGAATRVMPPTNACFPIVTKWCMPQ